MAASRASTEALIEQLVRDARPVRPVPRLRRSLLHALGVWAAVVGAVWAARDWPNAGVVISQYLAARGVWLGLGALGTGAMLYALARTVPGRTTSARIGAALGCAGGLAIAASAIEGSFAPQSTLYELRPLRWDLVCLSFATLFALPAAGGTLWLARRGCALRGGGVAAAIALSSTALGAVLIHTLCGEGSARHALAAHVLAPVALVPVLSGLLLWGLRRPAAAPEPRPRQIEV